MLSQLDNSILKELDRQNFKADTISLVMDKLDTDEKKNDFLSFMITNRNVILTLPELFDGIRLLNN